MPMYDYKCEECDYRFEVFHKVNEMPEIVCPKCGGKTRKLVSGGVGIQFKGSGFYVNDYKNKKAEVQTKS